MPDPEAARALASRILGALCDRASEVSDEDRQALLALAEDDAERGLALRLLAVLVLDRARANSSKSVVVRDDEVLDNQFGIHPPSVFPTA
jgi:hypothetical protein